MDLSGERAFQACRHQSGTQNHHHDDLRDAHSDDDIRHPRPRVSSLRTMAEVHVCPSKPRPPQPGTPEGAIKSDLLQHGDVPLLRAQQDAPR